MNGRCFGLIKSIRDEETNEKTLDYIGTTYVVGTVEWLDIHRSEAIEYVWFQTRQWSHCITVVSLICFFDTRLFFSLPKVNFAQMIPQRTAQWITSSASSIATYMGSIDMTPAASVEPTFRATPLVGSCFFHCLFFFWNTTCMYIAKNKDELKKVCADETATPR